MVSECGERKIGSVARLLSAPGEVPEIWKAEGETKHQISG